tara:strand:- start:58 stop:444 length:387 start_codon:yes stop_codon:yes gene_type:complete
LGTPTGSSLFIVLLLPVDPAFHPNDAVDGFRFGKSVIDGNPQCLEWHFSLPIPLCARDISSSKAAGAPDSYPFRSKVHCSLQSPLHGAPETDPAFQLNRHIFRYKLGIQLWTADLHDIDLDLRIRTDF